MVLDITQYGNPILRKKCQTVGEITAETKELVENMIETMRAAEGIGIAAPQVDIDLQLAVVDVSHDPECFSYIRIDGEEAKLEDLMPLVFCNPELELGKEKELEMEGCLSIQGINAKVRRPIEVSAKLRLMDGQIITLETDGLFARAIQHETDHLNGILFTDRVAPASKLSVRRKLKQLVES